MALCPKSPLLAVAAKPDGSPRWRLAAKFDRPPMELVEALPPQSVGGVRAHAANHIATLQALAGQPIAEADAQAVLGKAINALAALKSACDHAWLKAERAKPHAKVDEIRDYSNTLYSQVVTLKRELADARRELETATRDNGAASDAEVWEQLVKESV